MFFRKIGYTLLIILAALVFSGCTPQSILDDSSTSVSQDMGFDEVAKYISEHNELPPNYITKKEARALGWEPSEGNLHEVAPGKSIGGDVFRNREGLLPNKKGRTWYEADIHYSGGRRGSDRILYSSDGLIYKTTDHYESFEQLK
ncbi:MULTISPECIES: ribonuclease domain-containing protein [Paenibacillus]|uniref:ribonuclease domain-containing protein n=1 Tax=Paenibacillus TaxID=44249 RepID=UPI000FE26CA9|nr:MULTISPECIES: ribonuclease domain-containing protein [Paenibacillus]MCM3171811.1 ribonuclease [Paenibacillus sp. MER 99-2]